MKITKITDEYIKFDNGSTITFDHQQDCCEDNYADFKQLEELAMDIDFKEPLEFESCDYGFRFGNKNIMFFIPCYSEQNGYYTDDVDIYYNDKKVITIQAEVIYY